MDILKRTWDLDKSAVTRNEENTAEIRFAGHAAVFEQPTLIGSTRFGFVEEIGRDAFADVLDHDVRLLINHDGLPLARTINGTLVLSQDNEGLFNEALFAPTDEARNLAILLERGDVNQQSFAFSIEEESWSTREFDGVSMDFRTVNRVKRLYDTSIVTYPAYDGATGGLRTAKVSNEEITRALREVRGDEEAQALLAEKLATVESRRREHTAGRTLRSL